MVRHGQMATKHLTSAYAFVNRLGIPLFFIIVSSIPFCLILYVFTPSFSLSDFATAHATPDLKVDYFLVASLKKLLANSVSELPEDTIPDNMWEQLDDLVTDREEQLNFGGGDWFLSPIRVYVYNMPSKFTYDLLWLYHNTYNDTRSRKSDGTPVHRIIEQHSIDYWLWADLIAPENERTLKNVVRVYKKEEADLFYIPFFTTICRYLLKPHQRETLYREALKWVSDQPSWKRSEGRDHILPIHHPWSLQSVRKFMKHAIWLIPDIADGFWYKPGEAYLEKDVILPYVTNLDFCDSGCLSNANRTILLFFRGRLKRKAGGKIRGKLGSVLTGIDDVVIEAGTPEDEGRAAAQSGMRRSIFCLCPAGDTPSSARLFDAIVSGCIPVIVSDELELPFEGIIDYRRFVLFVSSSDATKPGRLISYLKSFSPAEVKQKQTNLAKHARHFLYSHPAQPMGPEDLAWRMIAGKMVNIKLHIRRSQRLVNESKSLCTCDCRRNPNNTYVGSS